MKKNKIPSYAINLFQNQETINEKEIEVSDHSTIKNNDLEDSNNTTIQKEETISIDNIAIQNLIIDKSTIQSKIITQSRVFFNFKNGNQISIHLQKAQKACPVIKDKFEFDNQEITFYVPEWITESNLSEYFLYQSNENNKNLSINIKKLLVIADYFNNQILVKKIINNEIIPYLNVDNTLEFLEESYVKLKLNSNWFDLFYASLKSAATNFTFYLDNEYEKIKHLNKKILEEIIEK